MKEELTNEGCYSLWLQYRPMWYKWAYKMSFVTDERGDWEQESFLILQQAVAHYSEGYGIAFSAYYRMLLYRYGKKKMLRPRDMLVFEEEEGEIQADDAVHIEEEVLDQLAQEEQGVWIEAVLSTLDAIERKIIVDFYFYNKRMDTIAKEIGMSYAGVECKKRRILKKLKKNIEKNREKMT